MDPVRPFRHNFTLRALLIGVSVLAVLFGAVRWLTSDSFSFYQRTGYFVPWSAKVLCSGGDQGTFHRPGEFWFVMEVDPSVINSWLASKPRWENSSWQRGPVPFDIGTGRSFGTDGCGWIVSHQTYFGGSEDVRKMLESQNTWYVARDRTFGWNSGDLLILDAETSQIWFSSWDT